jgi:hypothetical protein
MIVGRKGRQYQLSLIANNAHTIAKSIRSAKSLVSAQRRERVKEITESARQLVADLEAITDE